MDINCDAGESYGRWSLGEEEQLFPLVNSVNIACGFHAGDPWHIQQTILRALKQDIRIGAHPGYPDLVGFGRRSIAMNLEEIESLVLYQVAALKGMVEASGGTLTHVKPHGALYNDSARHPDIAKAIARAVARVSSNLILVGLANSHSLIAGQEMGLQVWAEVFADRSYEADGSLTPRSLPGSLLSMEDSVRQQVQGFLSHQPILTRTGDRRLIVGQTICIHSDTEGAIQIAHWVQKEVNSFSANSTTATPQ